MKIDTEQFRVKPNREKAEIKVRALADRLIQPKFSMHGFEITILSQKYATYGANATPCFECTIRVERFGVEINVSNPFQFLNPPILVKDGTKSIITNIDGTKQEIDNFKEDLDEAIKQMVGEAVRVAVSQIR